MHLNRWITSIVVLPPLGLLIFKGGPLSFAILIGIVSVLALWEYLRLVMTPRHSTGKVALTWSGLIMSPLIVGAVYRNRLDVACGLIALNLIFSGFIALMHFKTNPEIGSLVSKQVVGIVYVPLFLSFLVIIRNTSVMIRNTEAGIVWIIFLLGIVFAGDIGAYYIGRYLGRHKLAPAISPGKTIEGSIGGLATNLMIGALVKYFYFPNMLWLLSILFFLSIGIVGQVGDLFESSLKRSANIKDSGSILPGHGGILDRIDALLFVAPVAYLFKEYIL